MSRADEIHEELKRQEQAELERAEADARARGKEPFDIEVLERLMQGRSLRSREQGHRVAYYVLRSELMTLAEYAQHLLDVEPWEDAS